MGRPTYLPELAEAALRGGCLLGGVRRDVLLLRCMSPLRCRCYGASGEGMAPSALFNGYRWSSPMSQQALSQANRGMPHLRELDEKKTPARHCHRRTIGSDEKRRLWILAVHARSAVNFFR